MALSSVASLNFIESGPQSSSQREGTGHTWRQGDQNRDTTQAGGVGRETHRDRAGERPDPHKATAAYAKWVTGDPLRPLPSSGLDLGVARLDSEGKELRPSVTANRPHKASV